MLDMGFRRQIDICVHHATMARDRVTLMFSATFAKEIQMCGRKYLQRAHLFLQVGIVDGAFSGESLRCCNELRRLNLLSRRQANFP